jgi:DNA polymerase III alpha subunit
VKRTADKRGNPMCFFGIQDCAGECAEVVVFSSIYERDGEYLNPGVIVEVALKKDKTSYLMADDGVIDIKGAIICT